MEGAHRRPDNQLAGGVESAPAPSSCIGSICSTAEALRYVAPVGSEEQFVRDILAAVAFAGENTATRHGAPSR